MSGSTRTSADLDVRRRKVLFRAWHRGIREMDLIMGRFADARSEEHTSELQSRQYLACRLLLEKKHRSVESWRIRATMGIPQSRTDRSLLLCTSDSTTRWVNSVCVHLSLTLPV